MTARLENSKRTALFFGAGWFCWLLCAGWAQEPTPAPTTLAELQKRLAEHVAQPKFAAALWGVKVVSLDTSKTVFEYNPRKLFSPASNSKLYTVALALDRLGPDYRIRTSLYARAKPNAEGTLEGDLIVFGRGDPTIKARQHPGELDQALEPLANALIQAGVKRIAGDLVGDESYFHGPSVGSGWAWDDLQYEYGAEISALTINDNTLEISVTPAEHFGLPCHLAVSPSVELMSVSNRTVTAEKGAKRDLDCFRPLNEALVYVSGQMPVSDPGYTNQVPVPEPARMFVALFHQTLARHGIEVMGHLRTLNWQESRLKPSGGGQLLELGSMDSLPLREIARAIQKPSQNLYADLLLAHLGEKLRPANAAPERTSEELGIAELNRFLSGIGIKPGEVIFEEGSGLSRDNLTTPEATVALLEFMHRHPCGQVYLEALPIAGVDGTLKGRMKGTPAAGNVRAKTGSLRWAHSLSGYVTSAAGEHLAFSIMLNRYRNPEPSRPARLDIDVIPILLASFTGRTTD